MELISPFLPFKWQWNLNWNVKPGRCYTEIHLTLKVRRKKRVIINCFISCNKTCPAVCTSQLVLLVLFFFSFFFSALTVNVEFVLPKRKLFLMTNLHKCVHEWFLELCLPFWHALQVPYFSLHCIKRLQILFLCF